MVIRSLGRNPTEFELKRMIEEGDPECRGFITFVEFIQIMSNRQLNKSSSKDELDKAMNLFDKDRKGIIPVPMLKQVVTKLGEKLTNEEADEMIREVDVDGNGIIDKNEFVRVMANNWMGAKC